ncbi:hypothetical protein AB0J52_23220, partial [Spirillospora sp. NPDC049652]
NRRPDPAHEDRGTRLTALVAVQVVKEARRVLRTALGLLGPVGGRRLARLGRTLGIRRDGAGASSRQIRSGSVHPAARRRTVEIAPLPDD